MGGRLGGLFAARQSGLRTESRSAQASRERSTNFHLLLRCDVRQEHPSPFCSQIEQDLDCFWGVVESWNPANQELTYQAGAHNPNKLGTSRPLVNMNPSTWITSGKVRVTPAGSPDNKIIGTPGTGWDQSVIGRFIAINDPSEYYAQGEPTAWGPATHAVHRWWHITALEDAGNGYKYLFVEKTWWWVDTHTGPSLFRYTNYTTGPAHIVELDYIIAPGAWVSDVRRGAAANERTLVLAPSPSMSANFPFAPGDPITNPPGPNPWMPTAFRALHYESYPGSIKGVSFMSRSLSKVQLDAGFQVFGQFDAPMEQPQDANKTVLDRIREKQKDGELPYNTGIYIFAATNTAIHIRGPVQYGAIDLWQPYDPVSNTYNEQKIRWYRSNGASVSTLHSRPTTGDFVFSGGDLDYQGKGAINQNGLSGTSIPAKNLRGINEAVAPGATQHSVVFPVAESDSAYGVMIECSWITGRAITQKTTMGFTVVFDQPAPGVGGRLDWLLVR